MDCPFCDWLSLPGWQGRIQIRENLPALLERFLADWPEDELLYLGSRCDPYMALEETWCLTRRCLEVIRAHRVPLLMTTSAATGTILRDVELLRGMTARTIVVVELSRIPFLERLRAGAKHEGIVRANELSAQGLEVWTTLAPVLPGLTEIDRVLAALRPEIPVYVAPLQCRPGTAQAQRVMNWVRASHPEWEAAYASMIDSADGQWFCDLLARYRGERRIREFPYQL